MLTDYLIHLGKKYSAIVITIALLSSSFGFSLPIANAEDPNTDDLLQFSSQNHILGFRSDGIYVADAHHALTTKFVNANTVTPTSEGATESDTSGTVPALSKVTYKNLWNGIDAVYEGGKDDIMKSTYFVDITKRGVTANSIRLQYNRPVKIDTNGDLQITFDDGIITEKAPVAWQETPTGRHSVAVSFKLLRKNVVGFELGDYLPDFPVVIDPSLTWNTFLGGSGTDKMYGIAFDTSGNIYTVGFSTATWGSPVRAYSSAQDGFVAKLDSNGILLWNTFLGGSGDDRIFGIALDTSGNVYVGGRSNATWGSPVRAYVSGTDGFAAKLNSSGTLTWNTFLGGSGSNDQVKGLTVDSSGNVYTAGWTNATWGTPVRAYTSGSDGFAAKLDTNGALTWNTFLGGSGSDDAIDSKPAVDSNGNLYVGGYSNATWGSPVRAYTASTYDGFAAKIDSSGALTWNTFIGGAGEDATYGTAIDSNGNVYVGGYSTATWGSPVRAYTSDYDGMVVRLNSSGVLAWNTFLGRVVDDDGIIPIATDTNGNVYAGGDANATWGSPIRAYSASYDGFVVKLSDDITSPTAAITYSSASPYASGDAVTITATFSEAMADSPVPQISISGSETLAATDMTKVSTTIYTYDLTVGAGNGTATVTMHTGTDASSNLVTSAPTSGATFTVTNVAATEESTETVIIHRGGGRGSSSPGRGGTAPMIDLKTMQVISPIDSSRADTSLSTPPEPQQPSHSTQDSSPAVLLLQNQRSKLLSRIEKKIATAISSSVRKMYESTKARLLKRINARIESFLKASK